MFQKVSKLKNFGIFRDFKWKQDTPDFAKFNLIYGWNRTGKTTLSRVFVACEKRTNKFEEYPQGGEFEIKVKDPNTVVNHHNCNHTALKVRVFNRDYIKDNLFFDSNESTTEPIIYVGKEDIESAKELKNLQEIQADLLRERDQYQNKYDNKHSQEEQFRVNLAKRIKDKLGTEARSKYRNYNKSHIKDKIVQIGTENFTELVPEKFTELEKLIGSVQPERIQLLPERSFSFHFHGKQLNDYTEIVQVVNGLLSHRVTSQTIQRLEEDDEINKWVEVGLRLHTNKNEQNICLFCENKIKDGLFESLAKHFSDDYKNHQENISDIVKELTELKNEDSPDDSQIFLDELRTKYQDRLNNLNAIFEEINQWLDQAISKLEAKKNSPLIPLDPFEFSKNFNLLHREAVKDLNSVINEHNNISSEHAMRIKKAKAKIEHHMIASSIKEDNYRQITLDLIKLDREKGMIDDQIDENGEKISNLQNKASSIAPAITEINRHLEQFFGRKELVIELDTNSKGYQIRRNEGHAFNLSEGEKNAIAFSHFIVKTHERGFNPEESVIVIDDPVSSFDSNFTYHCFSLLKNSFTDVKQLILLTHNFEVFNLVKNQWFKNKNKKAISKHKPIPCNFFMLRNEVKNDKRYASIVPLPAVLKNFNSEYQFLFFKLKQYLDLQDDDYSYNYLIGNIARRFLEIFVHLKIPTRSDLREKIKQICSAIRTTGGSITETEEEKLYRLINESSHVRDPTRALNHTDQSEAKNAIAILMKIIEQSDKKHFDCLISEISGND